MPDLDEGTYSAAVASEIIAESKNPSLGAAVGPAERR
jgi:hypothetical protein